jgi:succinate dehydrogenase/fumarate reductase iron-sulfur protein
VKYVFIVGSSPGSGLAEARYELEADPSRTVLDALEEIRGSKAPGLLYRHSCHHGSCGTCGALINDKPRLMCLTRLGDLGSLEIRLEPLRKMETLEGLAVWPGPFFNKLPEADYLRPVEGRSPGRDFEPGPPSLRLEDCLECGLCVSACPVEGDFTGPAALLAAEVERRKHPERAAEMLDLAGAPAGVRLCERKFECAKACPQGLSPGRRIAELRKLLER